MNEHKYKYKIMKKQLFSIALIGMFTLTNCSSDEDVSDSIESSLEDAIVEDNTVEDSNDAENQDMLNELVQSMPSPLQISSAIKSSGASYNSEMLNPIGNVETYTDESKKALNIGVYGTDLGYINIYEKQLHVVGYMSALKTIAEDLQVGHFFDLEAISKMSQSMDDMEQLIIESTKSYNEMDAFLRDQGRGKISVLMALGAWVEGLHVLTQVYKQSEDKDLRERIAEQGIVVETVEKLASIYKNDADVNVYLPDLADIKKVYELVSVNEVEGETITEEIDGELVISSTGYTEFVIEDEVLEELITKVEKLRGKIISK